MLSEDDARRRLLQPSGLDGLLQERFAQVLSRFVDSKEALHLAAVLETGSTR